MSMDRYGEMWKIIGTCLLVANPFNTLVATSPNSNSFVLVNITGVNTGYIIQSFISNHSIHSDSPLSNFPLILIHSFPPHRPSFPP